MPNKPTAADFMEEAQQFAAQCWCDPETEKFEMNVPLAMAVAKRIAQWMATAAEFSNSVEFYRDLLDRCGRAIGTEAYTSDDGSVQSGVLALKVPELVERMVHEKAEDALRDSNLATRFPSRPADKTKWWIEGDGRLCIPNPDGMTITNCTQEYITNALREWSELLRKVDDLERDLNWRNLDRWLPEALKKLDEFYREAIEDDDRKHAEAYAAAAGIMRKYLGDSAEHERRMNRR